jgi:hypothetical protein
MESWIEDAFLAALSRRPSPAEIAALREALTESKNDPRPVLEDTLWALLSSREFLFNH